MKKRKLYQTIILCMLLILMECFQNQSDKRVFGTLKFQDASLGALHVQGTKLYDQRGKVVQLRGVSTHGLSWYSDYINEKMFQELHDKWGANVIRLAMYTEEYNGYCTSGKENQKKLKNLVKKGVKLAEKNNMYVIIDWHILSDGNPNKNKKMAKAFFKEISKSLKNKKNVLYEICNEPNGGTDWNTIKSYANEIIPIIHKNDEDAVIIVGTPNWSQQVDQAAVNPIKGKNIMYALHFYADTHRDSLRETAKKAIESGLPLFVSEFGISDASGGGNINKAEAKRWMKLLDENQISYVGWNLSNKNETTALIKSSCTKINGIKRSDLSIAGKWFYDHLRKQIGK